MKGIHIRPMRGSDVEPVIELVMKVFNEFVAPDFSSEGIASFADWANRGALAARLRQGSVAFVALEEDRIVGIIEWVQPDHLAMLFVEAATHDEGIGRRLFEESLREILALRPDLQNVRVHASRYAVSFYRCLGFREVGPEQEQDGIRYTPMLFELR